MKQGHEKPVDRVAARVVFARGESYEFKESEGAVNLYLPIPVRPFTSAELGTASFTDLRGRKFGRLTVIGIAAEVSGRWVCKCLCGIYVLRAGKAIKAAAPDACCSQCYLRASAKRNEHFRKTGKYLDHLEFLK